MADNKHWLWGAAVGAACGAVLALALGRPETPAASRAEAAVARPEPAAPPSAQAEPPRALEALAPSSSPQAPAPSTAAVTARPLLLAADVASTELRCARGAPEPCLDVGRYYAEQGAQDAKALTFRRRALILYAEACQRREAPACRQLSQLYEHGIGVGRDANTAAALLQRYLELCASGARCGDDPG